MHEQLTSRILDGKAVADLVRAELKEKIDGYLKAGQRKPGLSVVLIGDNPASHIYVKNKIQSCKKCGIESHLHQFDASVELDRVLACIQELNESPEVDGILVQLPLPKSLPTEQILMAIKPDKDVDGLHPHNLGLLLSGKPGLRPCTPSGIMKLLDHYNIPLEGKNAVVIGRSNLVGKPIALMLLERHASVTICHSRSVSLQEISSQADVLVVAAGQDGMVRGSWVKPGAVVIDVGIHRRQTGPDQSELAGDVEFAEAAKVASYITPVPGGIGPMTVAMLLSNTLLAYERFAIRK